MNGMKHANFRFSGRLWCVVVIILACVGSFLGSNAVSAPPNIVFLFSDDHAVRTLSAYGSGLNQTPQIDRVALEGAIFTRSYCANSICCPSRATILTGKHSHKNGVLQNGSRWDGNQFVFPRALSAAGYKTALFGKWHLRGWPTDEFDDWQVLEGAGGQGHYYNPQFRCSDGRSFQVEGYSADVITDASIDWMNQQSQDEQPFLLMCQFKAPHIHRIPPPRHMNLFDGKQVAEPETLFDTYEGRSSYAKKCWMRLSGMAEHVLNITPLAGHYDIDEPPYEFLARMTEEQRAVFHRAYDPENERYRRLVSQGQFKEKALDRYKYQRFMKDYLACVAAIDDNVGRILNWLDEHELAENTLVIYSSDQGFFTGEHGWNDKRWMYEQSLAMPLLMRWPAVIKPGTRISQMVQNIDYAPTLLDVAGLAIPGDVQGRSLLPLLRDQASLAWRKNIYYHYYMDTAYNLPRFEGVRTERYKLISYYKPHQEWELFDLKEDPDELHSVYQDPAYRSVRERLKVQLAELRREYDVPQNEDSSIESGRR